MSEIGKFVPFALAPEEQKDDANDATEMAICSFAIEDSFLLQMALRLNHNKNYLLTPKVLSALVDLWDFGARH
jgi:hypothetical protein